MTGSSENDEKSEQLQLPTLRHIYDFEPELPCGKCGQAAVQEVTVGTTARKTKFYFCFLHSLAVGEA